MRVAAPYLIVWVMIALAPKGYSQTLNKGEYFFDSDPGVGNGTPLTFTAGSTINTNFAININSLSTGFHNLNIRLRDNTGKWSHFASRTFYLAPLSSVNPPSVNVTKIEYFFDSDPGLGLGTNVALTAAAAINQNIVVPINSLTPGFHNLNFRVRDDKGRWSHFATRTFYIVPPPPTSASINITKAEYFFDSDPGAGLANNLPVSGSGTINQNTIIPITSLQPGFHNLNIRVKDDKEKWSHFVTRTFYIIPPPAKPLATSLVKAEYFFDTDPGTGNGTALSITSGNPQDKSALININSLSPGFHRLGIRFMDDRGQWSHFAVRTFYVVPSNLLSPGNIVRAEYFIDSDPDLNPASSGTALTITPAATIDNLYAIDLSGTTQGNHTLYVRVKDDKGFWSTRVKSSFNILVCTPPAAPTTTGDSRCNSGTATLNATSGTTGTQVYRWYETESSNTVLFTGAQFTTPVISATTDYYVTVYDPVTLCESSRTKVTATVTNTAAPVLNITGTVTICEGNFIKISAPVGYATYQWSNGEITREIIVNTAGDYTVVASNGTCTSAASEKATIIISPKPPKPTVTASGTTDLCDGASVTLTAPAGFSYLWSTGQTSQSITVTTQGNYSVTVADGSNCPSDASDVVAVKTFTKPTKPVIEIIGNTILCGTNTAGLLAPSGYTIYQWSGGQTTQIVNVAAAGDYSVAVGNASNCLSTSSDAVKVTSTGQPCTGGGTSNTPPAIDSKTLATQIEGKVEVDLTALLTDVDNNIDFTSLKVVNGTTSRGIVAFINSAYVLQIDYSGNAFTGIDRVTIEVCDLAGACAQKVIDIEVVGAVVVYNGLSPDGDGLNDFMLIKYIDVVEGASKNKVSIYNRWGDLVFEVNDYDNLSRVFTGNSSSGKELPSGTYFYKIDFSQGSPLSGYITLKR